MYWDKKKKRNENYDLYSSLENPSFYVFLHCNLFILCSRSFGLMFFFFFRKKKMKLKIYEHWITDAFDLKSLSTQSIFWSAAHSLTSIDTISGSRHHPTGCFFPKKYIGQFFERLLCAAPFADDGKSLSISRPLAVSSKQTTTKNISAEHHHYYRENSV